MRKNIQGFMQGWKFYLGDNPDAQGKDFDDSKWEKLDLPHDWSISFDFDMTSPSRSEGGYLNGGTGWYRKTFVLPKGMARDRISVNFAGVYMDSSTYVNGTFVGNYPNGYTPFSYDITGLVVADGVTENIIAIKVINQQPSSRWYSGSGIYRDVDLVVTDQIHVEPYGTFITTPNLKEEYLSGNVRVNIKTNLANKTDRDQMVVLKSTILDLDGKQLGETKVESGIAIGPISSMQIEQNIIAPSPELWSIDCPKIYKIVTEIEVDGIVKDTYQSRFGFRYFEMDPNRGFSLNGEWMKLKGVCMHHDQGALGAVASRRAIERQMQILKGMGVNAIRISHNPADNKLIEICETLGLLVIDEAFDTWYGGKKTYDYGRFFEKLATHPEASPGVTWAEYDLKQMINRGKNSPAIIMWSLGNEIGEASSGTRKPVETIKNLVKWTKEIDTSRLTTMGFDAFRFSEDGAGAHEDVAKELDAVGFNYAEAAYDSRHSAWPNWLIYGSETSSATKSRGVYAHPDTEGAHDGGDHADFQQSSYGNDRVGWGGTAINTWKPDRDRQFIAGQFIWTGFDYIGEPTPWHNSDQPPKSSYFGIIDTAGFPKDDYYFYQSQWLNVADNPMVHILPHWNWEDKDLASKVTVEGKIPVRVYSNAKKVELFKDGQSLGVREFESKTTSYNVPYQEAGGELYLEWRLPYEPGKLEAVAMDASGCVLARDVIRTAGAVAGIKLTGDRHIIKADGYDLSYITVDIVDKDGNFVPTADNLVNFKITGNGKIVGVDNGNALSHEPYKDTKRKAFNGKALVIVQSTLNEGAFSLTASSPGLTGSRLSIFTGENSGVEKKVLGYKIPGIVTNSNEMPESPRLISAEISLGNTTLVEDDIAEVKLVNKLEDGAAIDHSLMSVDYSIHSNDGGRIELIDNKIYAYNEGTVQIQATITYHELTVTTNTLHITITPNTREKTIISYAGVSVVTEKGITPNLPTEVRATFDEGLGRTVGVVWDSIDSKKYENYGDFIVRGRVEGQSLEPTARIIVKGPIGVQRFSTATPVDVMPKLPENATVYFSDTTFEKLPIVWENHTKTNFNSVGITTLNGMIQGTKLSTAITIRVSEDTTKSENLAKQWTGSTLPSGIASFTNREPRSLDSVTAINDTIISFNDDPHNRWTNRQSVNRHEDWVGIIFAKGGDMSTQFVDSTRIGFFQDSGIYAPVDFKIQYYVPKLAPPFPDDVNCVANDEFNPLNLESNWSDVAGLIQDQGEFPLTRMTEFKFDMVETYAIRIKMTSKPNMSLAITEMEVYGKEVALGSTFDVTSITLDGINIEEFHRDTLSYTIDLGGTQVPVVTAEVTNNASVTVVPANDTTQLIVTAENGIATKTYTLKHFSC